MEEVTGKERPPFFLHTRTPVYTKKILEYDPIIPPDLAFKIGSALSENDYYFWKFLKGLRDQGASEFFLNAYISILHFQRMSFVSGITEREKITLNFSKLKKYDSILFHETVVKNRRTISSVNEKK